MKCVNQEYQIILPEESRPLIAPIEGFTLDSAKQAVERLEHIARWMTIRDLPSPPVSQIQPDDIKMELLFEGENGSPTDKNICRNYQYKDGKLKPPRCIIKLTNQSDKTLYCTILGLTDRFAVVAPFFEAGYERLEPGQTAWAANKNYISFSIEPELRELGITEAKDILKLIVSTSRFDARLSTQDALDMPRTSHKSGFKQGTLNRFMDRSQFRLPQIEKEETYDDWYTEKVTLSIALSS